MIEKVEMSEPVGRAIRILLDAHIIVGMEMDGWSWTARGFLSGAVTHLLNLDRARKPETTTFTTHFFWADLDQND